jgi:hypothetical protein
MLYYLFEQYELESVNVKLQNNLMFERYIFNAHDIQRLDKIMQTLQILYTFFYYYYGVGPPLPSVQPQSFLE